MVSGPRRDRAGDDGAAVSAAGLPGPARPAATARHRGRRGRVSPRLATHRHRRPDTRAGARVAAHARSRRPGRGGHRGTVSSRRRAGGRPLLEQHGRGAGIARVPRRRGVSVRGSVKRDRRQRFRVVPRKQRARCRVGAQRAARASACRSAARERDWPWRRRDDRDAVCHAQPKRRRAGEHRRGQFLATVGNPRQPPLQPAIDAGAVPVHRNGKHEEESGSVRRVRRHDVQRTIRGGARRRRASSPRPERLRPGRHRAHGHSRRATNRRAAAVRGRPRHGGSLPSRALGTCAGRQRAFRRMAVGATIASHDGDHAPRHRTGSDRRATARDGGRPHADGA